MLYGGAGSDTIIFEAAPEFNNVDILKDFSASEGDSINIADLLTGFNSVNNQINNYVSFTNSNVNTIMSVDRTCVDTTYASQQIALISNVINLNAQDSLTANNLIV